MYVGFIWFKIGTNGGLVCLCGNVSNFIPMLGPISSARFTLAHELVTYSK